MKDITHYFSDMPKKAENAPTSAKEVKEEPAKIEETSAAVATSTIGSLKIKIDSNDKDVVCDLLNNPSEFVVDKTPSPLEKKKKKMRKNSLTMKSNEPKLEAGVSKDQSTNIKKRKKKNVESINQVVPKEFADSFSDADLIVDKNNKKSVSIFLLINLN